MVLSWLVLRSECMFKHTEPDMHSRAYYSRLIATLVNCSIELALIGPAPYNDRKKKVLTIPTLNQGILTEVEGSIHLTSSLR
jgi:hypothetical protein